MKFTRKQIAEAAHLDIESDSAHLSRLHSGIYRARRGFYYANGATAESWSEAITTRLTSAGTPHVIVDCGREDKPFRGGQSVARNSHFWVDFRVIESVVPA